MTHQELIAALAGIETAAVILMQSYYEARGGHMIDGPTALAELAYGKIETTVTALKARLNSKDET